ncbi:MAG TPA: hypothetical protein DET40_25460 [Lentisphaeria bacterium]|nr:MAG: hypothetical protein A2X45_18505 [Lentisphaerae bacterium GWF2_50_93]HCE46909.1 hypothetical protein [Lentisphaeria bacterium]
MAIKEEIIRALSAHGSGISNPDFRLDVSTSGKVSGFIISRTFAGMPQFERQNLLWDYLEKLLNPDLINNIIALITITPEENEEDVAMPIDYKFSSESIENRLVSISLAQQHERIESDINYRNITTPNEFPSIAESSDNNPLPVERTSIIDKISAFPIEKPSLDNKSIADNDELLKALSSQINNICLVK